MIFIGKWTLAAAGGGVVSVAQAGQLAVGSSTADPAQRLNAYGCAAKFVLQAASNGRYVTFDGGAYVANQATQGTATMFSVAPGAGGATRVTDLGVGGIAADQYDWNAVGSALGRVSPTSPPATAQFTQTIVTPGLVDFTQNGFPSTAPDLRWVDLSGADLSQVTFTLADLTSADLSGATLDAAVFVQATMTSARLVGATAHTVPVSFSEAHLEHADLSDAVFDVLGTQFTEVHLDGATLTGARLCEAQIATSGFPGAHLEGVDFTGAQVADCDFTGAHMSHAILLNGQVHTCDLSGADLTGAQLSNSPPGGSFLMQTMTLTADTNFTAASAQHMDFTGQDLRRIRFTHCDLTGSKLDRTQLDGADMSWAVLDECTITGNVAMHGVNLANSSLTGADLSGAQLGSIAQVFAVPQGAAGYQQFRTALTQGDGAAVAVAFAPHVKLVGTATVNENPAAPGRVWSVADQHDDFVVRLEEVASGASTSSALVVYQPSHAAVLTNAFMKGTKLTSANLYNVRASGVQLYGGVDLQGGALIEGAQFNNGNLAGIKLDQAYLYGVNFDYCLLFGASFDGAWLTPSASGGQASFNGASLPGASFKDANLADTIFTDAAVCVAQPAVTDTGTQKAAGVWLFDKPANASVAVLAQLKAASAQFTLPLQAAPLLEPGPIPAASALRTFFGRNGLALGATALVSVIDAAAHWQMTSAGDQYVISRGLSVEDDSATPALAVALGTDPLSRAAFHLPLSLEPDLGNGPVSTAIKHAFQKSGGVTLDPSASITVTQGNTDWEIVDDQHSIALWLQADGDTGAMDILARPTMPAVMALFTDNSYPLSRRATVSGGQAAPWAIDNDSDNPFNPIRNYIRFNAFTDEDGSLDLYGSWMRIVRLASGSAQRYYNYVLEVTGLPQGVLVESVICPNSLTVATNKSDHVPPEAWLRSRIPPRAPFCIPDADGNFTCPT